MLNKIYCPQTVRASLKGAFMLYSSAI